MEIILGRTEVVVKKRNEKGNFEILHKGVVIQETSQGWLRVYNPEKGSSDACPESSEWFPSVSNSCVCEVIGTRKSGLAVPIPALFR